MMVSIHQPQYLPWLGYFEKMDRADVFVFLDDVQFTKNDWQSRNKIRTPQGWQWLTAPVQHHFGQKINETRLDERNPWRRKHLRTLEMNYSKTPHFRTYAGEIESALNRPASNLSELCLNLIEVLCRLLALEVQTEVSSRLPLPADPTGRLLEICKKYGADAYYAGAHGRHYLNVDRFKAEHIEVVFQDYKHPEYDQCIQPFVPNMSVVDLLFNAGPKSLEIIRSGGNRP